MKNILVLSLASACLCGSLNAAIMIATASSLSHTTYDANASNSDLVNAGQSTLASQVDPSPANFGATNHNDGVAANTTNDSMFINSTQFPATIVYTLDTTTNTLGYDITTIRSIMGWDSNSTNHANQDFDVEVSLVGSAAFNNIYTATFTPFTNSPVNGDKSSMVTLTDGTGVIATGVDQLRFTYRIGGGVWGTAPGVVVRELDVEGLATIPEPTSSLLVLLGGLFALGARRRR